MYHRFNWESNTKKVMRKLDHVGIFLMIAGTFTPICLLILPWPQGLMLLIVVWCVAFFGSIQVVFFPNIDRRIRAAIYLTMGFIAVPNFSEMFAVFSTANSVSVSYTHLTLPTINWV